MTLKCFESIFETFQHISTLTDINADRSKMV